MDPIAANLARAIELDDEHPDHICPGCLSDVSDWRKYSYHFRSGMGTNHEYNQFVRTCKWTSDHLAARAFRRRYIARHTERAA